MKIPVWGCFYETPKSQEIVVRNSAFERSSESKMEYSVIRILILLQNLLLCISKYMKWMCLLIFHEDNQPKHLLKGLTSIS